MPIADSQYKCHARTDLQIVLSCPILHRNSIHYAHKGISLPKVAQVYLAETMTLTH